MKPWVAYIFIFLLIGCSLGEDLDPIEPLALMEVPPHFPDIPYPEDNFYTDVRWELGKKLFYDKRLSSDGKISCASCHDPSLAFADDKAFSVGANETIGTRNSPSLANVAYHPYFTREGGVPTLEMQVLVPIQEHNEFNSNIVLIGKALAELPEYVKLAEEAYDQQPNPYVITRALSVFERSLISGQSVYDLEIGYQKHGVMSEQAIRGMSLFFGEKTQCSTCHSGFNFTNYAFSNNGLYEQYADEGRARLTQEADDIALFKVPSLRNVGLTAPYMHDGSLSTLEAVVDHYNSGGKDHPHKDDRIRPLQLTNREKTDLIAFLNALTDSHFIKNENWLE